MMYNNRKVRVGSVKESEMSRVENSLRLHGVDYILRRSRVNNFITVLVSNATYENFQSAVHSDLRDLF